MASGDKFYIADKATLDEVKGKIGNTTDTGGSSTSGSVFGKLNYLVSQVSSYLSSVYTNCLKIGTTTDTGGSALAGTVMSKLNDVILKNGKLLDKNGGFLTAISVSDGIVMPEALRSSIQNSIPSYIKIDDTSIFYADTILNRIIRLNKTTFVKTGETLQQTGRAFSMAQDGTHLYYNDYTTGKIVKFLKSDMSKVAESAETYALTYDLMCIDSNYVYFADRALKKVVKLDKFSLNKVGESTSETSITAGSSYMAVDDTYIFLSSGRILQKYNKNTLVKVKETATITNLDIFHCEQEPDGFIYYKMGNSPNFYVVKVNKDFEAVSQFYWSAIPAYGGYMEGDTEYVYIIDYNNNRVIRINKSTMTISAVTETTLGAVVGLSVDSNFIYYADSTDRVIVKSDKIGVLTKYRISGYEKE